MNRKLILRPEAEAELAEAIDWYESRGKGLGADFMRAVDAAMAAIERNPERYQIIKGQVRRAVLRRFPYGLIYVASLVSG
jgi:plasmid stabilization system protein ParE